MANVYVRSAAAGAGTGADWTNAYTTLVAAFAAKAAGDTFYVSEDHAETQASGMTINGPGTLSTPCTVLCVNHAGTVPPVSADLRTTATITTTGGNRLEVLGFCYYYGITFNSGTGAAGTQLWVGFTGNANLQFVSCSLRAPDTGSSGSKITFNPNGNKCSVVMDNTTIALGNNQDEIAWGHGRFLWKNTANLYAGITTPSSAILMGINGGGIVTFDGLDLTNAYYSGCILFQSTGQDTGNVIIKNCSLHASLTLSSISGQGALYAVTSDSSATNYRQEKHDVRGDQTVETTIVRTGTAATDGTTPISWKIITTSSGKWTAPFESIPLAIKNTTTGSNVTVTVFGIWGGGAVPNNDDIWIEIAYMGSSSKPLDTINTANGKTDFLAAGAGQATDTSTWGGSTTKFKMSATLSSPQPALAGPIYVTVKAAKASSTFYIDPGIVLS